MKILIADDEAPARGELRYLLESLLPDSVFVEAANGEEALAIAGNEELDAAFLDIYMPAPDGLAVAAVLLEGPCTPFVVFVTAYDQHAIEAFELAALDYILKPVSEKRLAQTVERLRRVWVERDLFQARQESLRAYLAQNRPRSRLTKLWARRANENWVLVDYADTLWIVAEDKKVFLHTSSGEKLLLKQTLKELEMRLAAHQFIRVHKAYLVNLDHVAEIVPWFSGTYLIRMDDAAKTQIPLSRNYVNLVKRLTGWM